MHIVLSTVSGSSGFSVTQILLSTLAGGGLLGAIVALLKLRPDANTAAVTQSQSAMETMAMLVKQLEAERNDLRARAMAAEAQVDSLREQMESETRPGGRRKRDA